jgi:hypothetical protein
VSAQEKNNLIRYKYEKDQNVVIQIVSDATIDLLAKNKPDLFYMMPFEYIDYFKGNMWGIFIYKMDTLAVVRINDKKNYSYGYVFQGIGSSPENDLSIKVKYVLNNKLKSFTINSIYIGRKIRDCNTIKLNLQKSLTLSETRSLLDDLAVAKLNNLECGSLLEQEKKRFENKYYKSLYKAYINLLRLAGK